MPNLSILNQSFAGVDMHTNPLFLPEGKVAAATNLRFEEGVIRTRDGIQHHDLDHRGQFQGATVYSPSRGLSHRPFSDPYTSLITAVEGVVFCSLTFCGEFSKPFKVAGDCSYSKCGDVNLFQAENYLISHCKGGATFWWEGCGNFVCSPGLDADPQVVSDIACLSETQHQELTGADNGNCCFERIDSCREIPVEAEEAEHSSHDTFDFKKHRNFLINSAGLGIYAHGRIHQQGPVSIFVGDLIHKRGTETTEDLLLMEEQVLASMAPPLSVRSSLGQLRAIEILPSMNTANGEGDLIAYYDRGVVSFNTNQPGRETRHDAEGAVIREGWDSKVMVSHLLNHVSAVGRYAVYALPRDHLFRSKFGLHFLRTTIGDGSFRDEFINTFSQDVSPILDNDSKHLLSGTTVCQWEENHRILSSVGMTNRDYLSSQPTGRGLVVWNQAYRYTEDRSPISTWEGLWLMDEDMFGFHKMLNISESLDVTMFGGVTSDNIGNLYFSEFVKGKISDSRNNSEIPIEWSVTTARTALTGIDQINTVTGGRLELVVEPSTKVKVLFKTDESEGWSEWCVEEMDCKERSLVNLDLGSLPRARKEGSWFQFKVEGMGYVEIIDFEIEFSDKSTKINKQIPCKEYDSSKENYYEFIQKPRDSRWKD